MPFPGGNTITVRLQQLLMPCRSAAVLLQFCSSFATRQKEKVAPDSQNASETAGGLSVCGIMISKLWLCQESVHIIIL